MQLRYRLSQVSVASAHAKPGRALAAFGSLLGRMPADLPVTVIVTGKTVLSLTCPQLPLATMTCGAGKAPQFRTLERASRSTDHAYWCNTTDRSGAEVQKTNSMDPAIAPYPRRDYLVRGLPRLRPPLGWAPSGRSSGRRDRPYAGCAGWRLPVSR